MKKALSLLLACCMLFVLLAGCQQGGENGGDQQNNEIQQPSDGDAQHEEGFEFTYADDQPNTLNLLMASSNMDLIAQNFLQAGLFRVIDGELENDLCESYTLSDDGLTYTFTLRDAQWSDGQPVTSADFEYTLTRLLDPAGASTYSMFFHPIKNGGAYHAGTLADWEQVGVDCPDDKTLVITLDYPNAFFLETVTECGFFPLRQDFVEAQGEQYGTSPDSLLYCGPYKLESWELQNSITYVKNEDYWNGENWGLAGKITNVYIQDRGTAYAMYENNELDSIASLDFQYRSMVPEEEQYLYETGKVCLLLINENGLTEETGRILSNRDFRLALSYAIDREAADFEGKERASTRLIPESFLTADGTPVRDSYDVFSVPVEGDAEKAREHLDAALDALGYSSVSELPELSISTYEGSTIKTYIELIVDMWKQTLGLENINFTQLPIGSAIGQFYSSQYDIFYFTFGYGTAEYDILNYFVTGNEGNQGIWSNEEYNALLPQIERTLDEGERHKLLQQAESIMNEESPLIPLSDSLKLTCVKPQYTGMIFRPYTNTSPYLLMQKTAE